MTQQQISRIAQLGKLQTQRFFWHFHAYITIFSVMFLTLISLIFLSIHWGFRKLFLLPQIVEANQWDTSS
ncbi:MAG TPA: hypothetical protein VK203_02695 [Nostocaceae cyanobacterium]|nr:hypothetical protein [Nostocaceae cyanobacterium]